MGNLDNAGICDLEDLTPSLKFILIATSKSAERAVMNSLINRYAAPLTQWRKIMNDTDAPCQDVQTEMPRYRCHKEVWALKIKSIEQAQTDQDRRNSGGDWYLTPDEDGYGRVMVGHNDYVLKHKPEVGGYYVVYADGYKSYSPAKAFEDGYSLV